MALNIGDSAPTFSLPATDGNTYSYGDLAGSNATVVMFWCNHCPYVVPNQDRIIRMQSEYAERGVRFAAIGANDAAAYVEDDFEHMKRRAAEKGYNFPYLRDEEQSVAREFGAQRTPEVYLFDGDGALRYHGRIDDNHQDEAAVKSADLRNAIEAVLAGNAPDPAETGAMGCGIKWK
jgi:peroxiredoxin